MNSLVSVIIPAYNCEKCIEKCLESILNQTYSNIEVLIVNDGSTDGTLHKIYSYIEKDNRVKIFNSTNKGPSSSRNIGLNNAIGDYVMFVDSDDYLTTNAIFEMVKMIKYYDVDIVRTNFYYDLGKIKKNVYDGRLGVVLSNSILEKEFLNSLFWNPVWGQLIKKTLLKDIRFDTNLFIGEDLIFNYKVLCNSNKIYISDKCYYYYYYNINSITLNLEYDKLLRKIENTCDCYLYLCKNIPYKKDLIVSILVELIVSYERQLAFVSSKKAIKYIKKFNSKNEIRDLFINYAGKKYKFLIFLIKNNCYFIFKLYILVIFRPLKIIKNMLRKKI